MTYLELARTAHEINVANGWWDNPRPAIQTLWLVVCEMAEATEASRSAKYANKDAFFTEFDEYPLSILSAPSEVLHGKFKEAFRAHIKDTYEDELADVGVRILDSFQYELLQTSNLGYPLEPMLDIRKEEEDHSDEAYFFDLVYSLRLAHQSSGEIRIAHLAVCFDIIASLADLRDVNLMWHMEQKIAYNSTRGAKHGGKLF